MSGMIISRVNWKLTGHQQLDFCKKRGLTPVISRENPKSIQNICAHANETSSYSWKVADGFYWTCNQHPSDNNRWQKCVIGSQDDKMQGIPSMSDDTYKSFFS